MIKHGYHSFGERAIQPFTDTILLGSCLDRMLPCYTIYITPIVEGRTHVFSTFIVPDFLDLFSCLPFHCCDVLLYAFRCIAFEFQGIYSFEVGEVVSQGNPVLVASKGPGEWSMQVGMYTAKQLR